MKEYIEIYINNIKIKFNEFYCFPKIGVYSIKYKFNKLLDSTNGIFEDCHSIKSLDLSNFIWVIVHFMLVFNKYRFS